MKNDTHSLGQTLFNVKTYWHPLKENSSENSICIDGGWIDLGAMFLTFWQSTVCCFTYLTMQIHSKIFQNYKLLKLIGHQWKFFDKINLIGKGDSEIGLAFK